MVQFRLCASLPLLVCVLSTLTRRSNGRCEISTTGDPCNQDPSDGCWDYDGDTADGKPIFKKTITWYVIPTTVYMYYDADCDGPNGNSKYDHGQWMIASSRQFGAPSKSRTSDLDNSDHCVADGGDNAAYTDDTTSMIPPSGKWTRRCYDFWTTQPWQVVDNIEVTGCPDLPVWKRDYTYAWGQWTSNKAGSSCGGVDTRIAAQSCNALNGCSCKASTKWRADELQQTRAQPRCACPTTDYIYTYPSTWTTVNTGCGTGVARTRTQFESCSAPSRCSCRADSKRTPKTKTEDQEPCATTTTTTSTTTTIFTTSSTTTTATTTSSTATTTTTTAAAAAAATTSTSTPTLTDVRTASATAPLYTPSAPAAPRPAPPAAPQAGVDVDTSIVGSSSTNNASSTSPENDEEEDEDDEGGPSLPLGWIVAIAVMVLAALVLGGVLIATRVRASNAAEAAYAHAAGGDIAYNQAYNQGGSKDYLEPSARQSQLYDAAEETRRQIKAAVNNSGSAGPTLDADNYVLDDYYSTQQEGHRHGTVTARANSGAVYAIPMEEESAVVNYNSTAGKQHKAYGNAGTVVPRTPSYESAMLDGNDGQQKRPSLQSNPTYGAAAVGGSRAQLLTTARSKQQPQPPQLQQQQSVYLGFGDREDNETDNV